MPAMAARRRTVAFWAVAIVIGVVVSAAITVSVRHAGPTHSIAAVVGDSGGLAVPQGFAVSRARPPSVMSNARPSSVDGAAAIANSGAPAAANGGTPNSVNKAGGGAVSKAAASKSDAASNAGAPAAPRQFTVIAAGDILLHSRLWAQGRADAAAAGRKGYDFDPIFASARPDIAGADLAICHMETPYGKPNGPFTGFPVFEVPPQIAQTIHDVGYDSCSTASNHSLDGGEAGIDRTLNAL
ncbi:MAG TPA: CapA family protein, partial [Micromonosporaceae bacterium]